MVTISYLAKQYVDQRPMLQEAARRGIISYGALAEKIKPLIERELGKKAKLSAIVMALRRHVETLKNNTVKLSSFRFQSELVLKTNLVDICVLKSSQLLRGLDKLLKIVDFDSGDTLNISQGNREVSIVTNAKHKKRMMAALGSEKILSCKDDLVSLSMLLPKQFVQTPGVIFLAVRRLAWDNINIIEIISTNTELSFIIASKDATGAYNALQGLASSC